MSTWNMMWASFVVMRIKCVMSCVLKRNPEYFVGDCRESPKTLTRKEIHFIRVLKPRGGGRSIIGGRRGEHIHIFMFYTINFFWNRLFLQSVNTNIWIYAPQLSIFRRPCWNLMLDILSFDVLSYWSSTIKFVWRHKMS